MKVEQLIAELQKLPAGTEVVIFDGRKNISHRADDESSAGLYENFVVEFDEGIVSKTDSEARFATLLFVNEDYDKDGHLIHHIYEHALNSLGEALNTIADLKKRLLRI